MEFDHMLRLAQEETKNAKEIDDLFAEISLL
jgi:hypothetical protein